MHTVLVAVRGFTERFSEAAHFLAENNIRIITKDSLAEISNAEKAFIFPETEALWVAAEICDADFLSQFPRLTLVCKMGSGMDNIDVAWCGQHGVEIANSRGCNANAVAEMTLLFMLSSLRQLPHICQIAKSGPWENRFAGEELSGKTVGLLGFGTIARRVAALLAPFSVRVLSYDPYMDQDAATLLRVNPVSFDTLIEQSDVLSLHLPASKENYKMVNRQLISRMKDGAVLINCARGTLVDETALYEALACGKLSAAGIDVWEREPLSPGHPLFSLPNFIGTPHEAGMTRESMRADSMTIARSIVTVLSRKHV